MKLFLLLPFVLGASLCQSVEAVVDTTSNLFKLQQIYDAGTGNIIPNSRFQGGGFIEGDFLYLAVGVETLDGALYEVPLERNCK